MKKFRIFLIEFWSYSRSVRLFGLSFGVSHFGPVGVGRFGPISEVGHFGLIFGASRFGLIYVVNGHKYPGLL